VSDTGDSLTGSVWGDRAVLAVFMLVAGVLFIRPAIDPGPFGRRGVDWRQLAMAVPSALLWGFLVSRALVVFGFL